MKNDQADIKCGKRIWRAASAAALILAGGVLAYGIKEYREYKGRAGAEMSRVTELAGKSWARHTMAEYELMWAQARKLARSPELRAAWRKGDFEALAAAAVPELERLRRGFGITELNFIAPDRTVFLRSDRPYQRGSLVSRATLLAAERTGADSWGLEPGPRGTYMLRYVLPVKRRGKIAGYLELAAGTEGQARKLSRELNFDFAAIIRKKYSDPELNGAVSRAGYGDITILQQSAPLPPEAAGGAWERKSGGANRAFPVSLGEKTFACGLVRVPAAAGRGEADLVVMGDVTAAYAAAETGLYLGLALAVFLFCAVLALIRSVTRGAAVQLRETEELRETILRTATDGFLLVDSRGRVREVNEAYCRMSGYSAEELSGKRLLELESDEVSAEACAGVRNPVGRGEERFESRHRRRDGSLFDAEVSVQFRPADGGQFVIFARDVSESKKIKETLAQVRAQQSGAAAEPPAPDGFTDGAGNEIPVSMDAVIGPFWPLTEAGAAAYELKFPERAEEAKWLEGGDPCPGFTETEAPATEKKFEDVSGI